MKSLVLKFRWVLAVSVLLVITACSEQLDSASQSSIVDKNNVVVTLDVYKDVNCGCCNDWISHIEEGGFHAVIHHPADLGEVKAAKGIAPRYRSCHTGVTDNGYVFEGHIHADIMRKFLANPPKNAIGLAVPGMPVGSPGMEMGDRFDSYDILLLKSDGTSEVYVSKTKSDG